MNKGFTLIETLVAITILLVGVIGPLTLAARGISDGLYAQNELTATLLAQEAIEVIINRRNSNTLDSERATFDGIFDSVGATDQFLSIDGATGVISPIGVYCDRNFEALEHGCYLVYNEAAGKKIYENVSDDGGQFFRHIQVTEVAEDSATGLPVELKVAVTMKWRNHNQLTARTLTAVEYLYEE